MTKYDDRGNLPLSTRNYYRDISPKLHDFNCFKAYNSTSPMVFFITAPSAYPSGHGLLYTPYHTISSYCATVSFCAEVGSASANISRATLQIIDVSEYCHEALRPNLVILDNAVGRSFGRKLMCGKEWV
jgi:hypothetical protein